MKIIYNLKDMYSKNEELDGYAKELQNRIDAFGADEMLVFEELLNTFDRGDGKYLDKFDETSYKLTETFERVYEDLDIDNILDDVINYVALYGNQYFSMITNYHYNSKVWWIKRIIEG